jgi:hypothetical protein
MFWARPLCEARPSQEEGSKTATACKDSKCLILFLTNNFLFLQERPAVSMEVGEDNLFNQIMASLTAPSASPGPAVAEPDLGQVFVVNPGSSPVAGLPVGLPVGLPAGLPAGNNNGAPQSQDPNMILMMTMVSMMKQQQEQAAAVQQQQVASMAAIVQVLREATPSKVSFFLSY